MSTLIILAFVLIVLSLAGRWFTRTPSAKVSAFVRKLTITLVAIILIGLVATGRLHWLIALAGGLIPFAQRLAQILRSAKWLHTKTRPKADSTSEIETRFLRMTLDHNSNELSGLILDGQFKGRRLDELSLDPLLQLLSECRLKDPQSASLLETYLQRIHGDDWQKNQRQSNAPNSSTRISRDEALAILGLRADATDPEIRDAHRRLMQKIHPDRGGSDYLAAQINDAKAVLLEE